MQLGFFGINSDLPISHIAGIDEAGRGPCAGPVVAAAVMLPDHIASCDWISGVRDSKKLTAMQRAELFSAITAHCDFAIAEASVTEIDAINILQATMLAMRRAIDGLQRRPKLILVDGNRLPDTDIRGEAIVGGDDKVLSIAAASILAKVTRDRIMMELHAQFPYYGWDSNAGYGTAKHMAALTQYGVTKHHRQSYAPIRKILENKDLAA